MEFIKERDKDRDILPKSRKERQKIRRQENDALKAKWEKRRLNKLLKEQRKIMVK